MSRLYCRGDFCPVKNTCQRYTKKSNGDTVIRHCTNQRKYVQDKEKINGDSLRN